LNEYLLEFGLQEKCCPFEVFVTSPSNEPDKSKWQTDVYLLIN
jgi:hypothetical protein